jgi:hypothetical protein
VTRIKHQRGRWSSPRLARLVACYSATSASLIEDGEVSVRIPLQARPGDALGELPLRLSDLAGEISRSGIGGGRGYGIHDEAAEFLFHPLQPARDHIALKAADRRETRSFGDLPIARHPERQAPALDQPGDLGFETRHPHRDRATHDEAEKVAMTGDPGEGLLPRQHRINTTLVRHQQG